ncbi:hypothetical protein [Pararhodobacter marinus]|nr:hypothetical protein [Pararhodobacter marinus]
MMIPQAPLRSTMATIAAACVAGAVVIVGLALGYIDWRLFAAAAVIGVVVGVPVGIWIAHRMRATPPLPRPETAVSDPDAAQREVAPDYPRPYPPAPDQAIKPATAS